MSAASLPLPARLDLPAAAPLREALLGHEGKPLSIDASPCESVGTPGLQVLLAAAKSWREAGVSLSVDGLSEDCAAQLAIFGLSPDDLCSKELAE
ncbi:STAS domain-containing protein [Vannielia litorea]|uniref:STAS domain-containing protein n=1 Tax=Vannielia litorea TaxID=1217970 RepID=UPI001C9640C3|nr:STAS domain-containing protein [Vannielia litorea]MBY6152584.1 STAS domain-containing protein [Vannielia litorea]